MAAGPGNRRHSVLVCAMAWLLLVIAVIVGGIFFGVYVLYRHEVAHPAMILRQAAARNMVVVAAARKRGTSR